MKKMIYMMVLALSAMTAFAQDNSQLSQPGRPEGGQGPERRMMRMGPPPFDWWRNSDVAQKLNLSDQQKQQLEQAFNQARLQLVDLKGAVEKEQIKLQNLMNADPLPEQQVLTQIDAVQAARAKLEKNFALMALTFRKILTSDQWKTLQQQDILKFHHRREGGPPMPPPND
jgi:Spy/CpxP family protein refolding chaperone